MVTAQEKILIVEDDVNLSQLMRYNLEQTGFECETIGIVRHSVWVQEKEIKLTSMAFRLLIALMNSKGKVQSRIQLLNNVWKLDQEDIQTRTVDAHISSLKRKLGRMGRHIESIRGYGYRFSSAVN